MPTTSDVIVDALARAGIRYMFGYPGGQNMRFIEAMRGSPVEFVLVTHEGCAGFMADVTARLTGRPGACLSTLGPGATNMTTGVGNAFLDRVPVLAFTGTMGRRWRGRTVQMQIDHRKLFAPITKWSAEIRSASAWGTMGRALEMRRRSSQGRSISIFLKMLRKKRAGRSRPPAGPREAPRLKPGRGRSPPGWTLRPSSGSRTCCAPRTGRSWPSVSR